VVHLEQYIRPVNRCDHAFGADGSVSASPAVIPAIDFSVGGRLRSRSDPGPDRRDRCGDTLPRAGRIHPAQRNLPRVQRSCSPGDLTLCLWSCRLVTGVFLFVVCFLFSRMEGEMLLRDIRADQCSRAAVENALPWQESSWPAPSA
jgi:hypothetical protein